MCNRTKSEILSIVSNFPLYVLELSSFWASQIFTKLQKIVSSGNIYILSCKLGRCATKNQTKIVILSIALNFLYVLELKPFLDSQIFNKLQKIVKSVNNYILPCKLDLCATQNQTKSVILQIFLNFSLRSGTEFILAS